VPRCGRGTRLRRGHTNVTAAGLAISAAILAAGCAVNPVTGRTELHFVSEQSEIAMGTQSYAPAQQSQNGRYVVDKGVEEYVASVGRRLARVSARPELPYEFVVLNNSVPNAWSLPGGKIAINRGLLTELDNEAELAAVLGHEIVHAAARHGAQQQERGLLAQIAVNALGAATRSAGYGQLAVGTASIGAGMVFANYSREAESEADLYGMRYMSKAGYDPQAAVTLQETFVRLSKDRKQRQDWMSGLFASHPPSQQRVNANRATAASLPRGGTLGRAIFHRRLARLLRDKPAYKALGDGEKALAKKEYDKAIGLADKAISIEPREADFYALRGAATEMKGDNQRALRDYDQAVTLNAEFFQYYLLRGRLRKKLGDSEGGKRDLERSLVLFDNAPAHLALGELAEARGDLNRAATHYRAAAPARTRTGARARARYTALTGMLP